MQETSNPSTKARHTAGALSNDIIPDSETKSNPSEEKSAKKILEGKYSLSDREGREALAEAFYGMAETDAEREIVTKYRAELDNIDAKIAERGELIRQFEELWEGMNAVYNLHSIVCVSLLF